MLFFSEVSYILLCLVLMIVDGLLMVYLDDIGLWEIASMISVFGAFLPIYLALPLLVPSLFFKSLHFIIVFILASYGIIKAILWLIWVWAIHVASYRRDMETLRLKIVSINLLIASISSSLLTPFTLPDITAFTLMLAITISMSLIAWRSLEEYLKRKQIVNDIVSILSRHNVVKLEELMRSLKVSDYRLRDLLYELWHLDKIEVVEARGATYIYLRK